MNFDTILQDIDEFGRYQKLILWFILLPAIFPCGFHAYNTLFMAAIPDHWCRVPELDLFNYNMYFSRNISIPLIHQNSTKFDKCGMYQRNYRDTKNHFMPLNNEDFTIIHCKDGWQFDKSKFPSTVVSEWQLVCDKDFLITFTLVMFGASGLVGNYIFGYVQDTLGRKPAFYIYLLIQCIFGIATAFANNFWIWFSFRIAVGFTVPAILASPYVIAIELVGPRHRTTITILTNIAYSLSLILLAIIVWAVRDWRYLSLATTLPFIALFSFWHLLPESPRWLIAKKRYKEADRILQKMAKVNGKQLSDEYIDKLIELNKTERTEHERYGVSDLFKGKRLRLKTVIITFIWFTNTSVYVGLSYYAPILNGDEFLNFFLAGFVELPTYLFLWPAMERYGRRWTLCTSMMIGGVACLATFLVPNDDVVTLALYCIGKMGISSSFVVLPLMASELYPTVVRGLGMSLSSVMGMLGPVFIPLINYLGTSILALPLVIMGTLLVMGGIFALFLPETLNSSLPQTLNDAEMVGLECTNCLDNFEDNIEMYTKNEPSGSLSKNL